MAESNSEAHGAASPTTRAAARTGLRREHLLGIGAVILWGSFHPISKLALVDVGPVWLTLVRMVIGFLTLLAFAMVSGVLGSLRRMPRSDLGLVFVLGLCGNVLSPYLVTLGLSLLPAAVGSLLMNTSPLVVALLSPFMLGERLSRWALLGLVAGLTGVGILLQPGADPSGGAAISPLGVVFSILGGAAWALYVVLGRRLLGKYPPVAVTVAATGLGLPFLVLLAGLEHASFPPLDRWLRVVPHLLWLGGMTTGLAFAAWMVALRSLRASALAAYQYFIPVFAVIFAYLLLGERPTPVFLLGGGLVLVGVATAQIRR